VEGIRMGLGHVEFQGWFRYPGQWEGGCEIRGFQRP
jgi:hypothetical protein